MQVCVTLKIMDGSNVMFKVFWFIPTREYAVLV